MTASTEGWAATDCTLHWRRDGAGGPTVLMLHEMGGSLHSFDRVVELLDGAGGSRVRMDLRGFGQSEKPRAPYGFDRLAEDALAVLDAAGAEGPVVVIGVAMGSAVAADLAIRFPDRVARLILCAPSLTLTAEARASTRQRADMMLGTGTGVGMAAMATGGLAAMYPAAIRGPEFDAYFGRYMGNDPVGLALATRAFSEAELPLEAIRQPVLLLAGAHDLRPPAEVERMAQIIPEAEWVLVPGGGHMMSVQAPEDIASAARRVISGLR